MEWIKTAVADDGTEVWTAVEYVKGKQAYQDKVAVGDVPYVAVPYTPSKIDKRLVDSVWEAAKELTQNLSQLEYVQIGTSGVSLRSTP